MGHKPKQRLHFAMQVILGYILVPILEHLVELTLIQLKQLPEIFLQLQIEHFSVPLDIPENTPVGLTVPDVYYC